MSGKSEVATLLAQIDEEYRAAKSALEGIAMVGGHKFISSKMDSMGQKFELIARLVGKEEAVQLVVQQIEKSQR